MTDNQLYLMLQAFHNHYAAQRIQLTATQAKVAAHLLNSGDPAINAFLAQPATGASFLLNTIDQFLTAAKESSSLIDWRQDDERIILPPGSRIYPAR